MYYVNRSAIESRLACVPELAAASRALMDSWTGQVLEGLAQERCLHLALEIVTDVGSFLIDGFMMRDAGSYADIVGVIAGEGVISQERSDQLSELVGLRRALVQDYDQWPRGELQPLLPELGVMLETFKADVESYLERELDPWEQPR